MLNYQDYTQNEQSADHEHPNQFTREEFELLSRVAMDASRIARIMCDTEYSPDFKRKLIYAQMVYAIENIDNWVVNLKQNRNDDDLTYIFGNLTTNRGKDNE